MQLTANHDILVAIRTLVDYVRDEERRHYLEQLEQGEGEGHIYVAVAQIEKWLNGQPQVLHMVAGSDSSFAPPQADWEILTAEEATERFQEMLTKQQLPPIQYNPETDKVLARYEARGAMGHRFYGFAPLVTETSTGYSELTCERPNIPLGRWQVEVNGDVVYDEPEEEEEEAGNSELGSGEGDYSSALIAENQ